MNADEREVLLTAYALGELSEEEARELELELGEDLESRFAVDEIRMTAALLEEGLAHVFDDLGPNPPPTPAPIVVPNNLAHAGVSPRKRALEIKSIWGTSVLDTISVRTDKAVCLGDAPGLSGFAALLGTAAPYIDVPIWSLPTDGYPLAESTREEGASYFINLHSSFDGYLEHADGRRVRLDALRGTPAASPHPTLEGVVAYRLGAEETLYLTHGPVLLQLRYVREAEIQVPPSLQRMNYRWINFLIIAFVLHAGMVSAFVTQPRVERSSMSEILPESMGRFVQVQLKGLPGEFRAREDLVAKLKANSETAGPGRGRLPNEAFERKQKPDLSFGRRSAVETLLSELHRDTEPYSRLGDLEDALARVQPPSARASGDLDLGGFGTRQTGVGVAPLEPVDIGGLSVSGQGSGRREHAEVESKLEKSRRADESLDAAEVLGALDRDEVFEVIQNHRAQLQHCYERQLTAGRPELSGRLVLQWVIGKSGLVETARVTESELDNTPLERCLLSRVLAWRFPEPAGGGVVVVRLPLMLRPAR